MNSWTVRLGMVLLWLGATLALFTREWWAPANLLERLNADNLSFGAWVALGLTLFNLTRLILTRRTPRGSGPTFRERLEARRRKAVPEERNPELDFTRPDRPAP